MQIKMIEDHPYIAMLVALAAGVGVGYLMFVPPTTTAPAAPRP